MPKRNPALGEAQGFTSIDGVSGPGYPVVLPISRSDQLENAPRCFSSAGHQQKLLGEMIHFQERRGCGGIVPTGLHSCGGYGGTAHVSVESAGRSRRKSLILYVAFTSPVRPTSTGYLSPSRSAFKSTWTPRACPGSGYYSSHGMVEPRINTVSQFFMIQVDGAVPRSPIREPGMIRTGQRAPDAARGRTRWPESG